MSTIGAFLLFAFIVAIVIPGIKLFFKILFGVANFSLGCFIVLGKILVVLILFFLLFGSCLGFIIN